MFTLTNASRRRRGVLRTATATASAAALLTLPGSAGGRPVCGTSDGPCPDTTTVHHVGTFNGGGRERLVVRAAPRPSAPVVRRVRSGTAALIVCQARGARVSGPYGTSRIWDGLKKGGYVSDTRIYTGSDGRVAPPCGGGGSGGRTYGGDPFRYDEPGAWNGGRDCSGGHTRGALALKRWLQRKFNRTSTIGGYACRPNTANTSQMSLHAEGRALDWMISAHRSKSRRTVRRFIRRVAAENWRLGRAMGLQEIIWNGRIWTSARHREGWRAYTGPNPHTDHVHIGMNRPGARKRTSFWR